MILMEKMPLGLSSTASLPSSSWGDVWSRGRVTHICVSKLTSIGSDNGLSFGRCQAIIWTNAGILLTGTLETNFTENFSEINTFSVIKMHLKMSSAKWGQFCLGLNVLTHWFFKEVDVEQTTFWKGFSWREVLKFGPKYHKFVFLIIELTTNLHWFR